MEKTIFLLREVTWTWGDEPMLDYEGPNEVYKKFATYQEALAEKNRLEIDMVRHHNTIDIDGNICNANFHNNDFYEIILKNGHNEYFKNSFGIGWEKIPIIDKSKSDYLEKWQFNDIINDFILEKVLQDDKHILYVLKMIELDFYEIVEVKENDYFYKIYRNIDFQDFVVNFLYGASLTGEEHYEQVANLYYYPYSQAQKKLCDVFSYSLKDSNNSLKGSFAELSEAPELLKSYIESYAEYFTYNNDTLSLSTSYIYDKEKMYEIMNGLIALLRPEKIPFTIKKFPISKIPEKYLEYERKKKEEEEEFKRSQIQDGDLPF